MLITAVRQRLPDSIPSQAANGVSGERAEGQAEEGEEEEEGDEEGGGCHLDDRC